MRSGRCGDVADDVRRRARDEHGLRVEIVMGLAVDAYADQAARCRRSKLDARRNAGPDLAAKGTLVERARGVTQRPVQRRHVPNVNAGAARPFPCETRRHHELRELLERPDLRQLLWVRLAGQLGDGLFQTALILVVFFDPNDATSAVQAATAGGSGFGVSAGFSKPSRVPRTLRSLKIRNSAIPARIMIWIICEPIGPTLSFFRLGRWRPMVVTPM